MLSKKIKELSDTLQRKGLTRRRTLRPDCVSLDSNDYLSLSRDKRIAKFYQEGCALFPIGSGGSMLLSGYHPVHQEVENAFAQWLGVDGCLLFSSGYAANLALLSLLGALQVHCLMDKSVHASIYDGLFLAKVAHTRYLHNNLKDLQKKCKKRTKDSVVLTEGLFSMSGQIAPLSQMRDLSGLDLFVDEAHAFGVLGPEGKGAVVEQGLSQNEVPLRLISFGKAYAAQGALIAGKADWLQALMQTGRSFIYSTAVSPAYSYGLLKTLDLLRAADAQRLQLKALVTHFRECIKESPLKWTDSSTAIQQLLLGSPHAALQYQKALQKRGFSCSAIRAPTVPSSATGLRIVLNAHHQAEEINQLFKHMHEIYELIPY